MKKVLILLVTIVFGIALFTVNVSATMIQGEIGFVGVFAPTGGTGLDDATGVSFPSSFLGVADATGDFVPVIGQLATFTDFDFAPSLDPSPVAPLWTVSKLAIPITFSFDLESVMVNFQSATQLGLSGTGTLHSSDETLDDTPGLWNFTGNTITGAVFTFSSGSASVPDADIMLLLGPALIGLGLISRKNLKFLHKR